MDKIGKYEIIREIGYGATSTVYLAYDRFGNQQVAIKLFNTDATRGSAAAKAHRKLLLTEASLVGKLSHPHIVKILDAEMDGDLNYMVMEYVEGRTLEFHTEMDQLLPFSTIAEIVYKCCKALEYAQHQGIIHRDIKPANILLCGQNEIKISDFGAAMVMNQQTTQVLGVGSPAYMSPEQVNDEVLTHQTDIYSLGVTMYQLLTGKLPFESANNFSLIFQIVNVEPPPPGSFRPEIPSELDAIVQRAMQKDMKLRYQAWDQFAQDLVHFFNLKVLTQNEIYDMEKFDILRSMFFFKRFSDVELWEVLRISEWRKVAKDSRIINDGDVGRKFYILGHGSVKVLKKNHLLSTLQKGDCFGEMAHLSDRVATRTTDVVSESDVTLIEINPEALSKASSECRFQFNDAFLRLLVRRLNEANVRISQMPKVRTEMNTR